MKHCRRYLKALHSISLPYSVDCQILNLRLVVFKISLDSL